MLSEEEKAIIEVRKLRDANKRNSLGKSIETVLNLVTKLQKENEDIQKRKDNQEKRFKKYKENIDKQHEEIYENLVTEKEKYVYLYQKALDNTVKADKENIELKEQIDLMAEYITYCFNEDEGICKKSASRINNQDYDCDNNCKGCIKQYFEKLAKEKGE